jgi:hypothetical protein
MTGSDRCLLALHRERGHGVVTGSVVGGVGPGDWGMPGRSFKFPSLVKISLQISNLARICKFKMEAFTC